MLYKSAGVSCMANYRLGEMEARFAELIWENEPIKSGDLVILCKEKLNWAKPTTYTVLRTLCQKELFINKDGFVRSLISKEEYAVIQSEKMVNKYYQGSLPAFLAAFTSRKRLNDQEIAELKNMIDNYGDQQNDHSAK